MKKYKILFPCEPGYPSKVDSEFEREYNVARTIGFETLFYDYEALVNDIKVKVTEFRHKKKFEYSLVIMRGWMLKVEEYAFLYYELTKKDHILINTPGQYKSCHWLPYSYEELKYFSRPQTYYCLGVDHEKLWYFVTQMEGHDFIIKDYVKSEKGIPHLFKIDGNIEKHKFFGIIDEFVKERGKLFNEGIVLRQFIDLKKYEGEVNEWRCFFLDGKVASMYQNSNIKKFVPGPSKELVKAVGDRIKEHSNFFTIDFAEKEDGFWSIIETGDGQVSGLTPSQDPIGLINKFEYE